MKLFVLGNGFDIACGYDTTYKSLFKFAADNSSNKCCCVFYRLYSHLGEQELKSFENNICLVDKTNFNELIHEGYNANTLYNSVLDCLKLWIKSRLSKVYPQTITQPNFKDSKILTFNYSCKPVLDFDIESSNTYAVNGEIWEDLFFDPKPFIFGHDPIDFPKINCLENNEEYAKFCSISTKNIDYSLKNISSLISYLSMYWFSIESINIFGFSFSKVDVPVLENVLNQFPNKDELKININFHDTLTRHSFDKYYSFIIKNFNSIDEMEMFA